MTNEEAINVLRNTAWLGTEKDREEVKKALETISNTSEIPNSSDLISRQAAIDALDCINGTEEVLKSLPSAQPTLYGYNIEHLELIARVLQKEDLPPERIVEVLTDIGRIVAIVKDEFEEELRKAVEQCTI